MMSDHEQAQIKDVRDAIAIAKNYVQSVMSDERPINLGLEETEFDDRENAWRITVGFSRAWNIPDSLSDRMDRQFGRLEPDRVRRSYKVVSIGSDGSVLSMKNRDE